MTDIVILIHGFGFDRRIWSPVELAFEGRHTVMLSLPGFGAETVDSAYSMESLARQYWEDPDLNMAPAVHLVGHSMGGYVCLEMAAQYPDRVKSLTLIHSHVFADPEEKKTARTATMEDIRIRGREPFVRKMISTVFPENFQPQEIVDLLTLRALSYNDDAWYYGTQAIRDRKDHAETLRKLHIPVLIIMGKSDRAVPVALAYDQAHLAERTELHIYEGVGHMSMYEHTTQMIADLVRFYRGMEK